MRGGGGGASGGSAPPAPAQVSAVGGARPVRGGGGEGRVPAAGHEPSRAAAFPLSHRQGGCALSTT